MKKKFIKLSLLLVVLTGTITGNVAHAADTPSMFILPKPAPESRVGACPNKCENGQYQMLVGLPFLDKNAVRCACADTKNATVGSILVYIIKFVLGSVGTVTVLIIIYAGFRWAFSFGNPKIISASKDQIKNAIIGLILAMTSGLMLQVINPSLVKVEEFNFEVADANNDDTNSDMCRAYNSSIECANAALEGKPCAWNYNSENPKCFTICVADNVSIRNGNQTNIIRKNSGKYCNYTAADVAGYLAGSSNELTSSIKANNYNTTDFKVGSLTTADAIVYCDTSTNTCKNLGCTGKSIGDYCNYDLYYKGVNTANYANLYRITDSKGIMRFVDCAAYKCVYYSCWKYGVPCSYRLDRDGIVNTSGDYKCAKKTDTCGYRECNSEKTDKGAVCSDDGNGKFREYDEEASDECKGDTGKEADPKKKSCWRFFQCKSNKCENISYKDVNVLGNWKDVTPPKPTNQN